MLAVIVTISDTDPDSYDESNAERIAYCECNCDANVNRNVYCEWVVVAQRLALSESVNDTNLD